VPVRSNDDTVSPTQMRAHHRRVPGAELVVFENSAHTALFEEPERYTTVLTEFLAKADARLE
jgi:pimeloyl-ACP methyl ester carboxylesterase